MPSLMQQALGAQWQQLPAGLQRHYAVNDAAQVHIEQGTLTIDYPRWMQPYLTLLFWMGALINRRGTDIPTQVMRRLTHQQEQWQRVLSFTDGKILRFNSRLSYIGGNQLLEYTNASQALCMAVSVIDHKLHYEGQYFLLRLGKLRFKLPEWLVLGHTTIVEEALNDQQFKMDFRLTHPWFGELFSYKGVFTILQ